MPTKTITKCDVVEIERGQWEYRCWFSGRHHVIPIVYPMKQHMRDSTDALNACAQDIKTRLDQLDCFPNIVALRAQQQDIKLVTRCEVVEGARGWEYRCWYNGQNNADYAVYSCGLCTTPAEALISCIRDITKYRGIALACFPDTIQL